MSMTVGVGKGRPILLTVPEVLRKARISRAFFYKLDKAGKGPTLTRIGDRVFVSRQNLMAWLAQHEIRPAA